MVYFVSIPLGLIVLIIIIQAFTHPILATVFLARLFLGIAGLLAVVVALFSIRNMIDTPTAGTIFWAALFLAVVAGCFTARNKLGG